MSTIGRHVTDVSPLLKASFKPETLDLLVKLFPPEASKASTVAQHCLAQLFANVDFPAGPYKNICEVMRLAFYPSTLLSESEKLRRIESLLGPSERRILTSLLNDLFMDLFINSSDDSAFMPLVPIIEPGRGHASRSPSPLVSGRKASHMQQRENSALSHAHGFSNPVIAPLQSSTTSGFIYAKQLAFLTRKISKLKQESAAVDESITCSTKKNVLSVPKDLLFSIK